MKTRGVTMVASREFAARLRVLAAHRGMTMPEAMEKYLRPVLDREYRKVLAEVEREATDEGEG